MASDSLAAYDGLEPPTHERRRVIDRVRHADIDVVLRELVDGHHSHDDAIDFEPCTKDENTGRGQRDHFTRYRATAVTRPSRGRQWVTDFRR